MKYLIIIISFAVFLSCEAKDEQQTSNKFNLNFESNDLGNELSDGWFIWGNYKLSIDTIRHSGKYSGVISSDEKGSSFGSIAYKIPANYKGNNIQLEGFMKIENVESGFAGLLLRVDGNGTSLVFDNMQNQKISGTIDWKKYKINLPYPDGAETIFIAGILVGKGKAWFDDFVLTIDGEDVQTLKESEKPVYKANLDKEFDTGSNIEFPPMNEDVVTNLEILGRIWGFLKYYHPEIGKGNYNWDYELFRFLPEYFEAENTTDRDKLLINWINKYGTLSECKKCKDTPSDAFLRPDLSWIKESDFEEELENELVQIYQNRYQGKHFYIQLAPSVGNPMFTNEKSYSNMPYPDTGFRLLSLYKYWNMINYYFPYKHLTDKNWDDILIRYIPDFINANDEYEYELSALRLIGEISDTHANLLGGNDKINEARGNFFAPVHVRFIEEKLVVTDYYNPELKEVTELEIGDIITHINDIPVDHLIDSLVEFYPASNTASRMRDISADLLRSTKDEVKINYSSDSQIRQKDLKLYHRDSLNIYKWYRRDDEKCYKLLDGNIGYVTLKSIKNEDIFEIKESFMDTKGIIIDIRNYPSTFVPFLLGSYFVSSKTPFVKFTKGNINNAGEFTFTAEIEIPKPSDTYQGKLVVIVNELSQSQAEYTAMAFKAGDNTTIIGSTTAGADGNVSTILLPGGLRTMISGIGVYYPDGTETQRVGIVPDIEVKPTISGIRNGKDELLEKAIELIHSH